MTNNVLKLPVAKGRPETVVRRATTDDMMDVWQMLIHEMHPEVGIASLDFVQASRCVAELFDTGYVFVAQKGSAIIGSVGLCLGQPFWYSSDQALYDRWTFVKPDHRTKKTFVSLCSAAQKLSTDSGIPLAMAVYSSKDTERKNLLFRRRGFTAVGELFLWGFELCASLAAADRQPHTKP